LDANALCNTSATPAAKNFHHRPRSRHWQWPARLLKVIDDLLNYFAQLLIYLDRIIAVDARNQIRAFADVDLVLTAPFDPAVILIDRFHFQLPATVLQTRCAVRQTDE
jgi:hypothetical protein